MLLLHIWYSKATGDCHSLILTDYGDVYSFGRGAEGQLGHTQRNDERSPRLVSALRHETVVAIACGSSTSYAVTSSGKVYQWQVNFFIALGTSISIISAI